MEISDTVSSVVVNSNLFVLKAKKVKSLMRKNNMMEETVTISLEDAEE